MSARKKPVVGQIVYGAPSSRSLVWDALIHRVKGEPEPLCQLKVTKVGRKHFTAKLKRREMDFLISNWSAKDHYRHPFPRVYASPQEREDEKERFDHILNIARRVRHENDLEKLSLDQLRTISVIFDTIPKK